MNEYLETNRTTAPTDVSHDQVEVLAHDMRDLLHTAFLSFGAIQSGSIGVVAFAALGRSLVGLRDLLDRSLAELHPQPITHPDGSRDEESSSPGRQVH